jgi:hypothetical protein
MAATDNGAKTTARYTKIRHKPATMIFLSAERGKGSHEYLPLTDEPNVGKSSELNLSQGINPLSSIF